jgi:hypothetical protein
MGAALTYARRYALFTLVGIAGEDDLDAPDLNTEDKADLCRKSGLLQVAGQLAVDKGPAVPQEPRRAKIARTAKIALTEPESAAERARMIAEIERLQSSDEAADWVHSNLPAKNALTPEDGDVVEAAFQERLFAIDGIQPDPLSLEERASNDSDQSAPRRGPALDASKAPAPATNHCPHPPQLVQNVKPLLRQHSKDVLQAGWRAAKRLLPSSRPSRLAPSSLVDVAQREARERRDEAREFLF